MSSGGPEGVAPGLDRRERNVIAHDLCSADDEVRRLAVERLSMLPDRDALHRSCAITLR